MASPVNNLVEDWLDGIEQGFTVINRAMSGTCDGFLYLYASPKCLILASCLQMELSELP